VPTLSPFSRGPSVQGAGCTTHKATAIMSLQEEGISAGVPTRRLRRAHGVPGGAAGSVVAKKEVKLPSDARDDKEAATPSAVQLRDLVERVIFYVGVPAVTLYPIGALFYCVQFVTHYNMDLTPSWHAVLVIPRELVLVETITLLVAGIAGLLPFMVVYVALSFLLFTIGLRRAWGTGWRTEPGRRLLSLLALLVALSIAGYVAVDAVMRIAPGSDWQTRAVGLYHLVLISGVVLAGYLIARDRQRNRRSPDPAVAPLFVRRWFLRGALVAYVSAILGLFIVGTAMPLQLPKVRFGEDSPREGGLLLADPSGACGYWQYIDKEGRVVAISSEEVTDVILEPQTS
jgi:hypothetical protein